jgi:SAM-dependent methyltransferase
MVITTKQKPFHRCGTDDEIVQQLSQWYQMPLGQQLAVTEKACLDGVLPTLFGYHLVQVGQYSPVPLLQASKISRCTVMQTSNRINIPSMTDSRLVGQAHHLPLASDSVDVVILNHVLEFSLHPHHVLREVERVLVPEGHVIILMFNPWSIWLVNRLIMRWRKTAPWCGNFISSTRSKDWLALLGFEVSQSQGYFFRPAMQQAAIMDRLSWFESLGARFWSIFGGAYMLMAKKKIQTLTPIRPTWSARRRVVTAGLVESMESWRKKAS